MRLALSSHTSLRCIAHSHQAVSIALLLVQACAARAHLCFPPSSSFEPTLVILTLAFSNLLCLSRTPLAGLAFDFTFMSHLTAKAPPFRRPLASNAHEAHLPSPPETDTDFFQQHPAAYGPVPEMEPLPQARRTSTLSYRSTPLRDAARERSTVHLSKWLVVVVPPGSLIPHLGGPSVRASQGTLMPLLPTVRASCSHLA